MKFNKDKNTVVTTAKLAHAGRILMPFSNTTYYVLELEFGKYYNALEITVPEEVLDKNEELSKILPDELGLGVDYQDCFVAIEIGLNEVDDWKAVSVKLVKDDDKNIEGRDILFLFALSGMVNFNRHKLHRAYMDAACNDDGTRVIVGPLCGIRQPATIHDTIIELDFSSVNNSSNVEYKNMIRTTIFVPPETPGFWKFCNECSFGNLVAVKGKAYITRDGRYGMQVMAIQCVKKDDKKYNKIIAPKGPGDYSFLSLP